MKTACVVLGLAVLSLTISPLLAGPASIQDQLTPVIQAIRNAPDASTALTNFAYGLSLDRRSAALNEAYVRKMIDLGQPELAIDQARELVKLDSYNAVGWAVVGYANIEQGNMGDAMPAVARAAVLNPSDAFIENTAGQLVAWYDDEKATATPTDTAMAQIIRDQLNGKAEFTNGYNTFRQANMPNVMAQQPAQLPPAVVDDTGMMADIATTVVPDTNVSINTLMPETAVVADSFATPVDDTAYTSILPELLNSTYPAYSGGDTYYTTYNNYYDTPNYGLSWGFGYNSYPWWYSWSPYYYGGYGWYGGGYPYYYNNWWNNNWWNNNWNGHHRWRDWDDHHGRDWNNNRHDWNNNNRFDNNRSRGQFNRDGSRGDRNAFTNRDGRGGHDGAIRDGGSGRQGDIGRTTGGRNGVEFRNNAIRPGGRTAPGGAIGDRNNRNNIGRSGGITGRDGFRAINPTGRQGTIANRSGGRIGNDNARANAGRMNTAFRGITPGRSGQISPTQARRSVPITAQNRNNVSTFRNSPSARNAFTANRTSPSVRTAQTPTRSMNNVPISRANRSVVASPQGGTRMNASPFRSSTPTRTFAAATPNRTFSAAPSRSSTPTVRNSGITRSTPTRSFAAATPNRTFSAAPTRSTPSRSFAAATPSRS
ncbi:MAG: hypothetical protein EHM48_00350, partial [Planctomycetaceae bacterium]